MKNLQHFIPGANHWFGRGPKSALAHVTAQAQAAALSSLSELSLLFSSFIPARFLQPKGPRKLKEVQNDLLWIIADITVAARPGRTEPRAKKRRPKPYQNLNRPRSACLQQAGDARRLKFVLVSL